MIEKIYEIWMEEAIDQNQWPIVDRKHPKGRFLQALHILTNEMSALSREMRRSIILYCAFTVTGGAFKALPSAAWIAGRVPWIAQLVLLRTSLCVQHQYVRPRFSAGAQLQVFAGGMLK